MPAGTRRPAGLDVASAGFGDKDITVSGYGHSSGARDKIRPSQFVSGLACNHWMVLGIDLEIPIVREPLAKLNSLPNQTDETATPVLPFSRTGLGPLRCHCRAG